MDGMGLECEDQCRKEGKRGLKEETLEGTAKIKGHLRGHMGT